MNTSTFLRLSFIAAPVLLWSPARSSAQSGGVWVITASTLDSGGGAATGGNWSITGTIGQHDATAGKSNGGTYSEQGGFWPLTVVPGAEGPILTMSREGAGAARISWGADAVGYKLQYSQNLRNWTDYTGPPIAGASGILWSLDSGGRYYFRLEKLP